MHETLCEYIQLGFSGGFGFTLVVGNVDVAHVKISIDEMPTIAAYPHILVVYLIQREKHKLFL